jgi:hypothetical protein
MNTLYCQKISFVTADIPSQWHRRLETGSSMATLSSKSLLLSLLTSAFSTCRLSRRSHVNRVLCHIAVYVYKQSARVTGTILQSQCLRMADARSFADKREVVHFIFTGRPDIQYSTIHAKISVLPPSRLWTVVQYHPSSNCQPYSMGGFLVSMAWAFARLRDPI